MWSLSKNWHWQQSSGANRHWHEHTAAGCPNHHNSILRSTFNQTRHACLSVTCACTGCRCCCWTVIMNLLVSSKRIWKQRVVVQTDESALLYLLAVSHWRWTCKKGGVTHTGMSSANISAWFAFHILPHFLHAVLPDFGKNLREEFFK